MLLAAICFAGSALGQGIQFETGKWADVRTKAGDAGKLIFIDLYTTWCGPCKTMSNEIFPQENVGEYFNANFINYKIDAEKGEGPGLAKQYKVTAYPTFVFADANGNMVYRFEGAREADRLIKEGEKASELFALAPTMAAYAVRYADGDRKVTFLGDYWDLLKKSGLAGGTVLNDYLRALPDIELFREDRAKDIENISAVDMELYNRLAGFTLALDTEMDKSLRGKLSSGILKSLSTTFRQAMDDNDKPLFEELLALKARFPGTESAVAAMMGGGIAYLPEEQLWLSFYTANKLDADYRTTLEQYMAKLEVEESVDTLRLREAQMDMVIAEAKKKAEEENDPKALEAANRMKGMINLFQGTKYKVLSSMLLQAVDHYMKTESQDKEADKARAIAWADYAYQIDRSLSAAWNTADILEKIGEPARAKAILSEAVQLAEDGTVEGASEEDLEKVKARIAEM